MAKLTNELSIDVGDFIKGLSLAQQETIKLGEELKQLQDTNVADPFDQFNAQADIANKKVNELKKQLKAAIVVGDPKGIEEATAALREAEAQAKQFQEAAAGIEEQFQSIANAAGETGKQAGGFFDGLKEKIGGLGGLGEAASGGLGGILTSIPIPQVAALAAGITAVGGALVSVIESGKAANDALKNIKLQTGATEEELATLEEQASKAFMMGVGESSAEAIQTLGKFRTSLKGIVPDDFLGEATAKTNVLAQSLGVDTEKVLTGATRLAQKFGITYDEALAQVAAASQNGVVDIDGMLDAMNEFSGNAVEAGLSVEGFRGIMQQAGQAGVKDFGKIGDGIKELNNRIKSGDLAASVSQVAGPIGATLQGITRLAEEGTITAEQAAQQSIAAIEKARAAGEINDATRGELFTLFGGGIAEDLGADLYAKVYGSPIPEGEIAKQADKAGKLIDQRLAKQDPIDKLQRAFQDGVTDIGKALVSFYSEFIAPIINPVIDLFIRVKEAISSAFSGEGLEGAKSFFTTLQEVISNVISVAIEPFALAFEIASNTIKTIISALADAFAPLADAFASFGGEAEDTTSIFDTLKDVMGTVANVFKGVVGGAIRLLLKPLGLLIEGVAALIGWIGSIINAIPNAVQQFKDWALSFDFVRDAAQTLGEWVISLQTKVQGFVQSVGEWIGLADDAATSTQKLAEEQKKAAANTAAWKAEVTKLIKANALTEESIQSIATTYGASADEIKAFADANRAAILTAAGDINQLADNFNNALSAAQANLTKYLAAVAGGAKGFADEARKAQKEAKRLEAAQDAAAYSIDVVRQKQVAQQRAQAAAETLRVQRELAAQLIVDAIVREKELLRIQQESAEQQIKDQIALQQAIINAGGAGLPEAKAELDALREQQKQLLFQQEAERNALEGRFAQERLNNLIAAEQKARDAVKAINDQTLTFLERQFASFDLSGETLQKLVESRTRLITEAAEAEVRGLVESLPEYGKGVEQIFAKVGANLIDEEQAKKEIDALRAQIETALLAGNLAGADLLAQQIKIIRQNSTAAAADAAKETARAFRDAGISRLGSSIIKDIESQVAALEDQRDLLLQNINLTEKQRKEIEAGFAAAIDKVRRGPLQGLQASFVSILGAVREFKFELDTEEAAAAAEDLAGKTAEINEQLRAGEITYQEALDKLAELEAASVDTTSILGQAVSQALAQVADGAKKSVEETLARYSQLQADIAKIQADTTLSEEERKNQSIAITEKLAQETSSIYEQIGVQAASAFATAVISGEDAFKSLVLIALDSLQALVPILTAQIFGINAASPNPANAFSFGAAGLAAAAATTAILQGLVAAARAAVSGGFKEGGYTGNVGTNEVAGVVHGREFVVNAKATSKYRDVLEAMNSGKPLELLTKDSRSNTFVDINGGLHSMANIMADVRDRLDRIPDQAFTRQDIGVDLALDDRLYEKQRFRKQVRGLR